MGVQTLGGQDLYDQLHHSKWGQAQEGLDECVNKPAIQHLTPSHLELCACVKGPDANKHCSETRNKMTPRNTTL